MKEDKLPRKMSALIRVALADLGKVEEQSALYKVDMREWHRANSHCTVCFAGSVMAMTLGASPQMTYTPGEMITLGLASDNDFNALSALNELRDGWIGCAAGEMELDAEGPVAEALSAKWESKVTRYEVDRAGFKADMREMAADLEAAGL